VTDPGCYIEPLFSQPTKIVKLKAFLAGAYQTSTGAMQARLGDKLPLTDPFLGIETAASLSNDWVDWVLVQLRSASDPLQVLSERPALLREDGALVDVDGQHCVLFDTIPQATAFVAVYHRNHLPVMTDQPIILADLALTPLDFSDPSVVIYGNETRKMEGGVALMTPGDANGDGSVDEQDRINQWREKNGRRVAYSEGGADFNLDGAVNAVDLNDYWRGSQSATSSIPK
ncbi:MAG: hypothetical protein AAF804_13540, partial [Bacteroidota bacterium]